MTHSHRDQLTKDAASVRDLIQRDGKFLTTYRGRTIRRCVRVNHDNYIEVLVGKTWKSAYLDPRPMGIIIVR